MNETILCICFLCVLCHPLYYILTTQAYQANNSKSLYFKVDFISKVASSKITIVSSFIAFLGFIGWWPSIFLGLPLVILSWILFIRDRFRSLSRGLGAPGYFNFLGVSSLFTTNILAFDGEIEGTINMFIMVIFIILYVEVGSIFLSAGLFKSIDSKYQPPGFTIGMLNPMWSKIYNQRSILSKIRLFIDNFGPILQIISGAIILLFSPEFKIVGFYIIMAMFLSITPFCRLGWLCPAIACTAYILVSNNNIELILNNKFLAIIFDIAVILRLLTMSRIFFEYFEKCNPKISKMKRSLDFVNYPLYIYRTILGVIIWKVFTYDLVRITSSTCASQREAASVFSDSKLSKDKAISLHAKMCTKTNVYDSITLTSLICSQQYLEKKIFEAKIQKYMSVYSLHELYYYIDKYPKNLSASDLMNHTNNRTLLKISSDKTSDYQSIFPSQLNYGKN